MTPAKPRSEAEVTRDWLAGVILVATGGSVEQGKYKGRAHYEAMADRAIEWLTRAGMRLAIDPEAIVIDGHLDVPGDRGPNWAERVR